MKRAIKYVTLYDVMVKNKLTIIFLLYNMLLLSYNYWAINKLISYLFTSTSWVTDNNNTNNFELTYNESIPMQDDLYKKYNQMLNYHSPEYSQNIKNFIEIKNYLYFCQIINLGTLCMGYLLRESFNYYYSIGIACFVKLISIKYIFSSYDILFLDIIHNGKNIPMSLTTIFIIYKIKILVLLYIIICMCILMFAFVLITLSTVIFNYIVNWTKTYKIQYIEFTQNNGINDV